MLINYTAIIKKKKKDPKYLASITGQRADHDTGEMGAWLALTLQTSLCSFAEWERWVGRREPQDPSLLALWLAPIVIIALSTPKNSLLWGKSRGQAQSRSRLGSLFPARPHQIFHIEKVHNGTLGKSEAGSKVLTFVEILTFCGFHPGILWNTLVFRSLR